MKSVVNDDPLMVEVLFPPTLLSVEQAGYIRQCVDVIATVVSLFGFERDGYKMKGTYDHWIYCAAVSGNPMKYVKWKISAFYAFWKGQELPPSPCGTMDNPACLLGGKAYKWIRLMERSDPELFESLITTVLYSKKGMPRPTKKELRLAEANTFRELTRKMPAFPSFALTQWADMTPGCEVNTVLSRGALIEEIKRTVKELFAGEKYTNLDRLRAFFPSTSANYINNRAFGGAVGIIMEDPELLKGLLSDTPLVKIEKVMNTKRSVAYQVDTSQLEASWRTLYERLVERAIVEEPVAVPLALPEALKTRVITKGPPFLNTVLKPLQKKMWRVLKKHPAFKLVGETVTDEYVQNRMGKTLRKGNYFLSVDYANATNEMHSWCSEAASEQIAEELQLTSNEAEMLTRSLTRHTIELQKNGVAVKTAPQTVGQLMGSITSFPILCIVNAAICRWTLELTGNQVQKRTLKDCPFMVNGDDGLLRTTKLGKQLWEKIASFAGLQPSVGKVYISDEFLNINSTTFAYSAEPCSFRNVVRGDGETVARPIHFRLVPYINMGLLLGLKRSGGKEEIEDEMDSLVDVGQRATQLYETCPLNQREAVMKAFLSSNLSALIAANVPWFVPREHGGLGLPPFGEHVASDLDLRISRKIYEHPDLFKLPPIPVEKDWAIWEYATARFPNMPTDVLNNDFGAFYTLDPYEQGTTTLQAARAAACIEALFCTTLDKLLIPDSGKPQKQVLDLSTGAPAREVQRYLWKVQKTRKRALLDETIPLPEPFNPNSFPKKYSIDSVFFPKTRLTKYF